jgi:hypothetical protein
MRIIHHITRLSQLQALYMVLYNARILASYLVMREYGDQVNLVGAVVSGYVLQPVKLAT